MESVILLSGSSSGGDALQSSLEGRVCKGCRRLRRGCVGSKQALYFSAEWDQIVIRLEPTYCVD